MRRVVLQALALAVIVALPSQAQDAPPPPAAAAGEPAPAAEAPVVVDPLQKANELLEQHTLKAYQEALTITEELAKQKPGDLDVSLALARSLNAVMRAKTGACLVLVEGATDTPENKKLWGAYGKRAWDLAKTVLAARPKDQDAALAVAEGYMYYSASFGIITAIMQGAASEYDVNAQRVAKNFPKADLAVGEIYLGAFNLVAPWPMADLKKGRVNLEKAVQMAPSSARNRYYLGLIALRQKDWAVAEAELTKAKDQPCGNSTERAYCSLIKREAKRGLEVVAKNK